MTLRRPCVRSTWLALALTLFLALVGNLRLWTVLAAEPHAVSWAARLALALALVAGFDLLLQAAALPFVFKPVAVLLLLFTAVTSFFMLNDGVLIDEAMVRNVFETDAGEAGELVTPRAIAFVTLTGLLPALLLVFTRVRYGPLRSELTLRALVVLGTVVLAAGAAWPAYKELSFALRGNQALKLMVNPVSPLLAVLHFGRDEGASEQGELQPVAADARWEAAGDGRRRLVIFVLGETATASHFSLNGYARETNPELARLDVLNFPEVRSSGTATSDSVPCMFSSLAREEFTREGGRRQENLLDVLQRVGVGVLWRDNNSGCKGVCERVPYEEVSGPPEFFDGHGFFDEALLSGLQEFVDRHPGDLFIVLHQKGSHGPAYSRRSPPAWKRFLPECTKADVQDCAREEIVNAYDNTILYTDRVLAQVIRFLQANSPGSLVAMLYVSDHGESLGENGIYLHGFPYWLAPDEQTHVPMVFWASDDFLAARGLRRDALPALAARPCSHDNLFHSVLGLFGISTTAYDAGLDVFADACP